MLATRPGGAAGPSPLGRVLKKARAAAPKGAWKAVRGRLPHPVRRWGFERAAGTETILPERTRAFAVELHEAFVGVHLCVRGRMPGGVVEPGAASGLREEIARGLLDARDERGGRLVEAVVPREDLYEGPHIEAVPDLLVELPADCRWGPGLGEGPIVEDVSEEELREHPGSHRRAGIVVASGPGVRRGEALESPRVRDVGLSLLVAAGVPIPDDRDGRAWEEVLAEPVKLRPGGEALPTQSDAPTSAEQAAMDEALRGLGYL